MVDSIHEGTVMEIFDKGAIIALPYGVEGFVTPKHLVKEDGTPAKLDEKLDFKVIEFNKASKRIILSHSRVFEDLRKEENPGRQRSASEETKLAAKKLKASLERTTFGDISELAALKEEMEATEKKINRKKAKTSEIASEETPAVTSETPEDNTGNPEADAEARKEKKAKKEKKVDEPESNKE
jgi:small subunit ribosomal protein S1